MKIGQGYPQGGRSNACQEKKSTYAHCERWLLHKIQNYLHKPLHQLNSRRLERASEVWCNFLSTHHLLYMCFCMCTCAYYYVTRRRGVCMCWSGVTYMKTHLCFTLVCFILSHSLSLYTLCQQLPWKLFCSSSLHSWCVWLVSAPLLTKHTHTHTHEWNHTCMHTTVHTEAV